MDATQMARGSTESTAAVRMPPGIQKGRGVSGYVRRSSRKEYKFTFRVENNKQLFDSFDTVCTVRARDMKELKKNLKYDLRIGNSTDIDIYYYDEAFMRETRPRDLDDLYHASKGVCPKGGHKLMIHVVDSRVGLRR